MITYTYKDPFSFPHVSLNEVEHGVQGIFPRNKKPFENYAIREPLFLQDPDHTGIFNQLTIKNIHYRQPFILSLKNAELIGVRTYLTEAREWFNDQGYYDDADQEYDLNRLADYTNPHFNEYTRFKPTDQVKTFTKEKNDRAEVTIKGNTLILTSQEPNVFGSWIFRVLPKMNSALELKLNYDHILIEPHPQLLEYLNLLGIDRSQIIAHNRNYSYHLEQAIIPSLQNSHLYLDTQTRNFYHKLRDHYADTNSPKKKIFISRLNHYKRAPNYRMLLNEKEVVEVFKKKGFQIIYPELLNIIEQIKAFSSASIIVGPSGSALFNCIYCQKDIPVIDIESQSHHLNHHAALFSSFGVNYGFMAGKVDPLDDRTVHQNWSVNIPALVEIVDKY